MDVNHLGSDYQTSRGPRVQLNQRFGREQPGYGRLLVRNMLASPVFAHAVQNVSELGTERQAIGPYYPSPTYTSRRAFARLGCAR